MPTEPKSKHIPRATIQRLATYVQVLENFARDGVEVISSNPLAEACGVNGSQVRKDLALLRRIRHPRRGLSHNLPYCGHHLLPGGRP